MAKADNKKIKTMKDQAICLHGIILPADWDDEGNITRVLLSTPEEEEYLLLTNNIEKAELLKFLRKDVEVTGYITEDGKRKKITVETFTLKDAV